MRACWRYKRFTARTLVRFREVGRRQVNDMPFGWEASADALATVLEGEASSNSILLEGGAVAGHVLAVA